MTKSPSPSFQFEPINHRRQVNVTVMAATMVQLLGSNGAAKCWGASRQPASGFGNLWNCHRKGNKSMEGKKSNVTVGSIYNKARPLRDKKISNEMCLLCCICCQGRLTVKISMRCDFTLYLCQGRMRPHRADLVMVLFTRLDKSESVFF